MTTATVLSCWTVHTFSTMTTSPHCILTAKMTFQQWPVSNWLTGWRTCAYKTPFSILMVHKTWSIPCVVDPCVCMVSVQLIFWLHKHTIFTCYNMHFINPKFRQPPKRVKTNKKETLKIQNKAKQMWSLHPCHPITAKVAIVERFDFILFCT